MKIYFLAILLIVIPLSLARPSQVHAQAGALPFGGLASFKITCDCSGGQFWIWFTPLYLGPLVTTGPLVYSPFSSILYAYYHIGVPDIWHLGDYTPGASSCWIVTGNSCSSLPSYGLMGKVGTNYPSLNAGTPIQAP